MTGSWRAGSRPRDDDHGRHDSRLAVGSQGSARIPLAFAAVVIALALLGACGNPPRPADEARRLADEGRHDEAVAGFEAALAVAPDDAVAVSGWCRAMRRQGRTDAILVRYGDAYQGAEAGDRGMPHEGVVGQAGGLERSRPDGPGAALALGLAAIYANDADAAEAHLARALESYRVSGDTIGQASALSALGVLDFYFRDQSERALERLGRAESLAREAGDEITTAEILNNRGNALMRGGDGAGAEASFVEADRLAVRHGLDGLRATVLTGLGNLRQDAGDLDGAIDVFRRAIEAFRARGDRVGEARAGINLVLALQRAGRHRQALDAANAASEAASALDDPRLQARTLEVHGNSLIATDDLERAREVYTEARRLLDGVEAPDVLTAVWTGLGNVELATRDLDAACAWYTKSLELNVAVENPEGEAVDRLNLGNAHIEAGRWAAAAEQLDRAVALYDEVVDDPGRHARALIALARVDEAAGNPAPARERLERALDLAHEAADASNQAFALSLLGHRDLLEGNPAAALARFEESRALLAVSDQGPLVAQHELSAAEALRALGRFEEARHRAESARRILGNNGDRHLLGLAEHSLGRTASELRDDRRALASAERAERLLDEAGDDEVRIETLILAARMYERGGDARAARTALEVATRLERNLLDRAGGTDLETGLQALSSSAARAMALFLVRSGDPVAALEALETGRARALRRRIAAAGLIEADDDQARAWRRARAEIARVTASLRRASLSKVERAELLQRLDHVEREAAQAVRDHERGGGLVGPGLDIDAAGLRARLQDGEALAVYALDDPRSYLWLVRREGIELLEIAGATELRASASELSRRLQADDIPGVRQAAEVLGREVVAPLASRWTGLGRLYVVPDDALWRVPFHALRVGDGERAQCVAEFVETVVLPATALLPAPSPPGTRGDRPALAPGPLVVAFGDPRFSGDGGTKWRVADAGGSHLRGLFDAARALEPLPASGDEARAIERLYPPGRALALVGERATEKAFQQWADRGPAVLHVASHALSDDKVLERSALAFATGLGDGDDIEDGLLTVGEIAGLRLDRSLVVLSACRTAGHRVISGEGMQGLARAFLGAGARGVVATQWPVDDRAAAAMMVAFHRGLARGHDAARALNDARLELMHSPDLVLSSPTGWAAFVLIGDARFALGKG